MTNQDSGLPQEIHDSLLAIRGKANTTLVTMIDGYTIATKGKHPIVCFKAMTATICELIGEEPTERDAVFILSAILAVAVDRLSERPK